MIIWDIDNSLESRLSSANMSGGPIGSDKMSIQKVGNSKILVVKKKAPQSVGMPQNNVSSPPQ